MRQGQQHRRGRGRNNNGGGNNNHRRGQNPLSRSFESNGPDVKVRGTPADIASKYMVLARDAQSSGDPVLAENYFQHAEHYNRIIMAYRDQQGQQHEGGQNSNPQRFRPDALPGQEGDDANDEASDEMPLGEQPSVQARGGEQPRAGDAGSRTDDGRMHEGRPQQERQPHEGQHRQYDARDGRDGRFDGRGHDGRPRYGDHQQRYRDRNEPRYNRHEGRHDGRQDRGERFDRDRDRGDRFDRDRERGERHDRNDRGERGFERHAQQVDPGFPSERRPDEPRQDRVFSDRPLERLPIERNDEHPMTERGLHERPVESARPAEPPSAAPIQSDAVAAGDPPARAREGSSRRRAPASIGLGNEQPEFLRRPVRRPRREAEPTEAQPPASDDGQGPQS